MKWQLPYTFDSSHGRIRYGTRGEGPPVVLVHGTPWSSFNWRHLIPRLAEQFTVHYYDLLGYGQSEMSAAHDVSLGVQNEILAELLDHWELTAPAIIGHDFGGATTLRTHLLNGRDFAKIVLLNAVALAPWGSPFFKHVQRHEAAFADVPAYIHKAIVTAYVDGATFQPMNDETLTGILAPWLGEAGQAAFYRQIAQADQRYTDEVEPRYGEITRPVLILWGEADTWIPIETGRRLHASLPTSEFRAIPKASHLVQEDAPEMIGAHIINFLR